MIETKEVKFCDVCSAEKEYCVSPCPHIQDIEGRDEPCDCCHDCREECARDL